MALHGPIARLNELTQGITTAILTTVRPDGTLHSRPMATRGIEADGAFWFLTNSNTEKVEAVRTQQRVSLCFADAAANRYVSVSGFCELVRERSRSKELWDPNYKNWLPQGLDDENLILMKIVVQQAEYWDTAQGRMVALTGFDAAAIT